MKKILITRKLLKASTEKASKIFDVKLNNNSNNLNPMFLSPKINLI